MVGDERLGHRVPEAAREHRGERLHLHLAEARQRLDPPLQVGRVGGVAPDAARVAAVVLGDDRAELLHALRHVAREAVDRRLLAEDLQEPVRVGARDLAGVEAAQPLLQLQRAEERRRHRHLLVEHEPDQERERLRGDQRVGLGVPGEVQRLGHGSILPLRGMPSTWPIRSRRPRSSSPRPSGGQSERTPWLVLGGVQHRRRRARRRRARDRRSRCTCRLVRAAG